MSQSSYSNHRHGVAQSVSLGQIDMNIAVNTRRTQWSPPVNEDGSTGRSKVLVCSAIVDTAGTLTGSTLNIFNGTTSIGSIAVGTSAIDTRIVSAALNTTLTTGDILNFRNSGSDATVKLRPQVEWVEPFLA